MRAEAVKYLEEREVKPSVQRIAIMEYLLTHRTHPTVDEIFNALSPSFPTLSKTTVYNTLKLLVDKGAVLRLDVDDKEAHYDGDICKHGHFYCLDCGKIIDILRNVVEPADIPELQGLETIETQVYFKGYCSDCAARRRQNAGSTTE